MDGCQKHLFSGFFSGLRSDPTRLWALEASDDWSEADVWFSLMSKLTPPVVWRIEWSCWSDRVAMAAAVTQRGESDRFAPSLNTNGTNAAFIESSCRLTARTNLWHFLLEDIFLLSELCSLVQLKAGWLMALMRGIFSGAQKLINREWTSPSEPFIIRTKHNKPCVHRSQHDLLSLLQVA